MENVGIIIGIILILIVIIPLIIGATITNNKKNSFQTYKKENSQEKNVVMQPIQTYEYMPYYLMKSVMTQYEKLLYSILEEFCRKYRFVLLSKVRLADFIQPQHQNDKRTYYYWFNRISAKHVDFLVCELNTIKPLCAIELDDYTHRYSDRQERDEFINNVYRSIQLPILHFYEIKQQDIYNDLAEILNITLENEAVTNSQ